MTGEAGGEYDAGGGSKSPQRRRVSVNAPALPVTPEFVLTLACVARDFMTRGVPAVLDTLTSALSADSLLDPGACRVWRGGGHCVACHVLTLRQRLRL